MPNTLPTGLPEITGTSAVGATLTAGTGGIADADGTGTFSYQWLRDGEEIAGATGASYQAGALDAGAAIGLRVSYTDGGGTAEVLEAAEVVILTDATGGAALDPLVHPLLGAIATDQVWTGPVVTYAYYGAGESFTDSPSNGGSGISTGWSLSEQAVIASVLGELASFLSLTFTETADPETANLALAQDNLATAAGYAFLPSPPDPSLVVLDAASMDDTDFTPSQLATHEIGHAMGLEHPFSGTLLPGVSNVNDPGDFGFNQYIYTAMSYSVNAAGAEFTDIEFYANSYGYGAFDIAALQGMYGANDSHATGADSYGIPDGARTIWDAGGADVIDFSAATLDAVIDLRAATLETEAGGGGFASYLLERVANYGALPHYGDGVYTIAYGVMIEEARGGVADDLITGNDGPNRLVGNWGDDTLRGGSGDDLLQGDQPGVARPEVTLLEMNANGLTGRRAEVAGIDTFGAVGTIDLFVQIASDNSDRQGLLSFRPDADPDRYFELILWEDELRVVLGDGSGGYVSGASGLGRFTLADDNLHRLTVTVDAGAGLVAVYMDGDHIGTVAFAAPDLAASISGSGTLYLGEADGTFHENYPLQGFIGEVALYDAVLEAAEVLSLGPGLLPDPGDARLLHQWSADGRLDMLPDAVGGSDASLVNVTDDVDLPLFPDDDLLEGGDGNDTLSGGVGNDTLEGGAGDDILRPGRGRDSLDGGEGLDLIDVSGEGVTEGILVNLRVGFARDEFQDLDWMSSIEGAIGTQFADGLYGSDTGELFLGGDGADIIHSDGGDDTVSGGPGDDNIWTEDGRDLVDYSLFVTLAPLNGIILNLAAGVATEDGYGDSDSLTAVEDAIGTLHGDDMGGSASANLLIGLAGDDTIIGREGDDTIQGGDGADMLSGGTDNDLLEGGGGTDMLDGEAGNDTLTGGAGDDTLTGGDGADVFVAADDGSSDLITDFQNGIDRLDLRALETAAAEAAVLGAQAGSVILSFAGGGQLTLQGIDLVDFGLDDVLLRAVGPVLRGTAREDEVLEADVQGVSDPEGIVAGSESLRWQRDGVDIPGATGPTYTLGQADVGAAIRFVYSYEDGAGNLEEVTSDATAAVENVQDYSPNFPLLTGIPQVGQVLAIDISPVEDEDGIVSESYIWLRDGQIIAGESGPTYIVREEDIGADIYVVYRYTDAFGDTRGLGTATLTVSEPPQGAPVISGEATQYEVLSVDVSSITDPDGIAGDLTYQWLRNGVEIDGATGLAYTLVQEDVGAEISLLHSYTDGLGVTKFVTSEVTAPVANVNDNPTGVLWISGVGAVGFELTPDTSWLVDQDGIDETSFSFRWRRDNIDIPGATGDSYTLTEADIGFEIDYVLTYTDLFGNEHSRSSRFVHLNSEPTGEVSVTGTAQLDETLTADPATIVEPDGITPDTYSYQWIRDGAEIFGATGASYTLTQIDIGREIRVEVSYLDLYGTTETVSSAVLVPAGIPQLLVGTPQSDTLVAGDGNDTIEGLGAADRLDGWRGDDTIDGGAGFDTALYALSRSYTVALDAAGGVQVIDRSPFGTGSDTLVNVEFLEFGDVIEGVGSETLNLAKYGGPAGLAPEELESFIELYIAYFNRAPDALGLNFWGSRFADGRTLEFIAERFSLSEETAATYPPGTTTEFFVETVYNNVLGRDSDPLGLANWVDKLDSGRLTRDTFILRILDGAKADLKPELGEDFVNQQLADRKYLEDKTDIGAYFAVIRGMSDVDDARDAMAFFDGTEASIGAAVAAVDRHYADALDPVTGDFLMPLVGVLDDPFAIA